MKREIFSNYIVGKGLIARQYLEFLKLTIKKISKKEKIMAKTNMKEHMSFSYRSFMISGLMLKSLIHLALIFMDDVRWESNFILLYVGI